MHHARSPSVAFHRGRSRHRTGHRRHLHGRAGCTYQDIAAAVAAAKANPGRDLIELASITFYPTAPIVVQDSGDLTIEGGYGTCGASEPLFDTTIDGTFMSPAAYLVAQGGGGSLTLRWLQLQNSNGGAIDSVLSGPLMLDHVQLHSNNADFGAGIFISGNSIFRPQLTLANTAIYGITNIYGPRDLGAYESARPCYRTDSVIATASIPTNDARRRVSDWYGSRQGMSQLAVDPCSRM